MLDQPGLSSMYLEPGQRLAEDASVDQRALGARVCAGVAQAALKAEHLPQPLDVASCQRQRAKLGCFLSLVRATTGRGHAQRHQQAAEQDGVGERVRRRLEPTAVCVQRRERTPHWIAGALVQLD